MCGILGSLPKTDETFFKRALDTIVHRGPDDYGIWSDNNITLGHRRLSILDLSTAGHQPMSYANGRFQIVFNGEIYNFLEIRKTLQSKNYQFKSDSDTEVVLAAFLEWGEECLHRFNGMWALAIWDRETQKLFLSRDRFGKKPLFYAQINGQFVFASEMKAIYPFLPEIKPSKDFQWMVKNTFLYENTDKCLIEGIKRFPAGHSAYFENGAISCKRYWSTLDHLVTPPDNYNDQVEEYRELFVDACKIRMRSDVAIGTALSGGLDSSATIATMAHISNTSKDNRISGDWQHAFVAAFPDTPLDESHFARKVVDHINIDATYIDIDPLKHWDKLDDYLYLFEEIFITSPIPMLATYGAVREHRVKVTIDGHGADELFSGYGHLREALWDAGCHMEKILDILNTHQETLGNDSQFTKHNYLISYVYYILKKLLRDHLNYGYQSKDINHSNFKLMDNFSQQLYIIFNETILPTLLRNYDRYSMINSVEIRMPFMDHRLVSYVHSLPYTSKFGGGYTKRLIRDAVAPYLPDEITYRKSKIGFNSPILDWMQGPLKPWFEDTVHSQDFLQCELIDHPNQLRNNVLQITSGDKSVFKNAVDAWTKMTPYLWEKAVIKRQYNE